MLEEIERVKKTGFAVDDGEEVPDIHCIGVPVLDYRNYPVAALWVVGPSMRLTRDVYPEVGRIVREHALKISHRLGYDE